jgi:hypothetical protein
MTKQSGVFNLWSAELAKETKIESSELHKLYPAVTQHIDNHLLKGLLRQDR